ncbi:MAG TPA: PIN domain-containing protein [Opitutaceae bacterium]|nr:PIN domain-containing protein [Opitutaceae bacterium]
MKLLVDTTVWIDFFRGSESEKVTTLEKCIRNREDICCCGFVLTEVLQGIREENDLVATKRLFEGLIYLDDDRSTFELAATIYRELRRKGSTIRNSIDCLIAAVAIQHGVVFLENDRDYQHIDLRYPLKRL